jgi:EpsI family protein
LFGVELPAATPGGAAIRQRTAPASFLAAGALVLAFIAITFILPRPAEIYPERISLAEFPRRLGAWNGRPQPLETIYADELKLDDYLMANYVDDSGTAANVYIAYYNSQRKGEAVHSPRSCLPGGGWQMKEFGQRTLPGITAHGEPLRVNRTLIELGNQRELVYYWFAQRGRIITNEFAVKWFLFVDALTRHRTDGALVRLIIAAPPSSDVAAADEKLRELAALIVPQQSRFVPD